MIPIPAINWAKFALGLVAIGACVAVVFAAYQVGRSDGGKQAENELLKAQVAAAEARAAAAERIATLERDFRVQGEQMTALLDSIKRRAERAAAKLEEALRANPAFAGTTRPDDVHRVRVEQLGAIEAATRSAAVPDTGDAGMRAPGQADGADARRDGAGGRREPAPVGGLRDPA